ncbi:MAG: hypothetical protein BWY74_00342 [Firmicutes bacterium ADurb.Bin419]|nr:MAG: hypothetical protein BWY74_00342 [Firmicutes bacterium ADurb.Bin419]
MKKITPELSGRSGQFRFIYRGKSYSIINLTNDPSGKDSNFSKIMSEMYGEHRFELYDGDNCYRFTSLQEAFNSVINKKYKEEK